MSDESQTLAESTPAQAPEVTATTDQAQNAPEVAEQQQTEQPVEEKKYSQAEIDAMISKRLAREQRKWEREQKLRAPEPAQPPAQLPPQEQFESPEEIGRAHV